jgi:hypothetical protein
LPSPMEWIFRHRGIEAKKQARQDERGHPQPCPPTTAVASFNRGA